ncbi:PHP domain-containing protein [uncultured Sphaerochaeta sp.]|uniref:PHP domain-containing protein n=1 Tax=uncultured Sphaerochaeta sp. TaxID=886478 RepID=UPI002A0A0EF1|nr:PHP domain-containing protein [uncultured Sphaerochaeta sp.]
MDIQDLELAINDSDKLTRMEASLDLGAKITKGDLVQKRLEEVNNHVHTTWSFSPYEPAAAAFQAWKAGLGIVGSIDHDSIGAAQEMLDSAQNLGIASTVGFELRVSFLDTPLGDRKINNPDSKGIAYMCVHGVPRQKIGKVEEFLKPVHIERNKRNKAQVEALQALVGTYGYDLDFERTVVPLSHSAEGGSITERHILYAMALQTIDMFGKGEKLVRFLEKDLKVPLSPTISGFLLDEYNPHYAYDLLGVLKGNFLPRFFIQPAVSECIDVRKVVGFGKSIGAIPAYAYLGDVAQSVTGDKKSEYFEDGYLDELFDLLSDIGFPAVTYMPPRNTVEQMQRLQTLAKNRGMMEISGVDINSSRQSFNCPELLGPCCHHLVDSAWALVAHEKLSTCDENLGLFSKKNPLATLSLEQRIERYAKLGRKMDPRHPLDSIQFFD